MEKDDLYLAIVSSSDQDAVSEIYVWGAWLEFERSWK